MTDKPPAEAMEACPNPWCSSTTTLVPAKDTLRGHDWRIACGCGVRTFACATQTEAIAAWNRRTPAVPDEGLVEELGALQNALQHIAAEADTLTAERLIRQSDALETILATLSTSRDQATGLAEEADQRLCFGSMSKHEVYRAGWNEALAALATVPEGLVEKVKRGLMDLHYAKGGDPCTQCDLPARHPVHMSGKEYEGGVRAAAFEALEAIATLSPTPPVSGLADDEEAYEIGKRDGYEKAIQELDEATGGDGEFYGSAFPGETVDVPVMRRRIIDRLTRSTPAPDAMRERLDRAWKDAHDRMLNLEPAVAHMRSARKIDRKDALSVLERLRATLRTDGGSDD